MTDRNTIIRECIAALPRWPGMGCNIRIPLRDANGPMKAFVYPDDAQAALTALLSAPDQADGELQWGEEIAVNGERPEWLGLDESCIIRQSGQSKWIDHGPGENLARRWFWSVIDAIRLPADHPYYQKPDNWTPDERTVNAVCDWFDAEYPHSIGADKARKVFLPPDPIAALVEAFSGWLDDPLTKGDAIGFKAFASWLVSEGRLTL